MTSSFYFVVYAVFKQNKPVVYPKVIVPGLVSGIMWGIATSTLCCWLCNSVHVCMFLCVCIQLDGLSQTQSYP